MTRVGIKKPIVPFTGRKSGNQDQTRSGAQRVYSDENVLIYHLASDPGKPMTGRTTHKRWEDDGFKNPVVASRVSVVIKGELLTTTWEDDTKQVVLESSSRPVGAIGGTHRNIKGYHEQHPASANTEWVCVYLKDTKVKDGTLPVYFEAMNDEVLGLLPKGDRNILVMLSGKLRVAGEPDINDYVSVRGDIGLAKSMRCLGPCQFLRITLEDDPS